MSRSSCSTSASKARRGVPCGVIVPTGQPVANRPEGSLPVKRAISLLDLGRGRACRTLTPGVAVATQCELGGRVLPWME